MATNKQYLELYGQIRKILLSRYFALGRYFRNDYFQESTNIEAMSGVPKDKIGKRKAELLKEGGDALIKALWSKEPADRDNPWLFGSKLTIALATEARFGLLGAEPLLDRSIRSCEQLFSKRTGFSGFPLRYDPVTFDYWMPAPGSPANTPPDQGICDGFLITPDGQDYILSTPPNDPRHFPYVSESTGRALMGRRLYKRYLEKRNKYIECYRKWEPSQDELVGVVTTYVAAAEGTKDPALRRVARSRLRNIATYLSDNSYLVIRPRGGLTARGPGAVLPALEWPFAHAIARAVGDTEPAWSDVSFQEALQKAGLWDLFKGPTDRAMAAAWLAGLAIPDLPLPSPVGPLASIKAAIISLLAGWSLAKWSPKFLTPGHIGFVAGIYLASDGFDCWDLWKPDERKVDDSDSTDMAMAALFHSWPPEARFRNYVEIVADYTKDWAPFSTGFMPFLGFLAAGGMDTTTSTAYDYWLRKRLARRVDTDPVWGWSSTCFASAVALLLSQGMDTAEEKRFLELLDAQHARVKNWPGKSPARLQELPIAEYHDIWAALDYLSALALAWRYRSEREAAGATLPKDFPSLPPSDVVWPEPAVPRLAVDPNYLPVAAIQGRDPPKYNNGEARLFAKASPRRPPVPQPNLTFDPGFQIYDETFSVGPGAEVFTGIVLQWGDEWEVSADGQITVGGAVFGPEGGSGPVDDARYPVHSGHDPNATEHCLLARLNNYIVIKSRRRVERWLYLDETFLYLRLNQASPSGTGTLNAYVRVRGSRRPLTQLREVSCVTRDKKDPDRRIDAIGGVERDGKRWQLTLDEAIAKMTEGVIFFVRQSGLPAAEIVIRSRKGRPYLATVPDPPSRPRSRAERRNNLSWSNISECPT
jgi:hypothetical protein